MSKRKLPTVRDLEWVSVSDLAESLGVCRLTVIRYINAGVVQASKPPTCLKGGGPWRIPRDFALRFIKGLEAHKLVPVARPKARKRKPRSPSEPAPPDPRQLALCP